MLQNASKALILLSGIAITQLAWADACPKHLDNILQDNVSKMGDYIDAFDETTTDTLVSNFETIQKSILQYPAICFQNDSVANDLSNFISRKSALAAEISQRITSDIARKKNFVDVTNEVALLKRMNTFTKNKMTINAEETIEASKRNQLAQKASCPSQDLRSDIKPYVGPIQNQDEKGWCYAFQSAAMLSNHFHEQVSATAFAVQYNINKISDNPNLSDEGPFKMLSHADDDYMESILNHRSPVCRETQVASDLDAIKSIETIYNSDNNLMKSDSLQMCAGANVIYPELDRSGLGQVYHELNKDAKSSPNLQAKAQIETACSKPFDTSKISIHKEMEFGNDDVAIQKKMTMFKDMDKVLASKQPVALNMNGCILENVNYSPPLSKPKDCYHAIVVVGSRFNPKSNQCEYLIRNSWGKGDGWGEGLDKTFDGHAWISKEAISKGSMSAWWFNKDKP